MTQLRRSALDQVRVHAVACLEGLLEQIAFRTMFTVEWDVARHALEALPLSTGEAGTVRNRFASAQTYVEANERGAACYELRLLARALKNA